MATTIPSRLMPWGAPYSKRPTNRSRFGRSRAPPTSTSSKWAVRSTARDCGRFTRASFDMSTSYNRIAGQSVERLAALSDGVFAVARHVRHHLHDAADLLGWPADTTESSDPGPRPGAG